MSALRPSDVEFVVIAEAGILEAQALLLCASLRAFGGALARAPITVVSPRPQRRPSAATERALERLEVEYLAVAIDSCAPDYGSSYRIHGVALIERRAGPAVIVQLDSDAVFVREIDAAHFDCDAAARPVDVKGMCTTGAGDPFDPYWRRLCDLTGADYDALPVIRTTVDQLDVRASYNGGLLVARRALGLFNRTEENFRRIVAERLYSWTGGPLMRTGTGFLQGPATAYWGTSQAAFSLAAVAARYAVRILPPAYNFPLHSLGDMRSGIPSRLIHLHYHWLFADPDAADQVADARLGLPEATIAWLQARLPLPMT
jgi:hypothetical protein